MNLHFLGVKLHEKHTVLAGCYSLRQSTIDIALVSDVRGIEVCEQSVDRNSLDLTSRSIKLSNFDRMST